MGLSHEARTCLAAPSHDPRRAVAVPHSPEKVIGAAGTDCIPPCECFAEGHLHFCVKNMQEEWGQLLQQSPSPDAHLKFLWLLTRSDPAPGHRLCFTHHCCCHFGVCGHLTLSLRKEGVCAFFGKMQTMQPLSHFNAITKTHPGP